VGVVRFISHQADVVCWMSATLRSYPFLPGPGSASNWGMLELLPELIADGGAFITVMGLKPI